MSELSYIEKRLLEKFFEMEGGYVLDFTDRTFEEFFRDEIEVNIRDDKYAYASGSKANRMRAFWKEEANEIVGKLIGKLLEYWKTNKLLNKEALTNEEKDLLDRSNKIAEKLAKKITDNTCLNCRSFSSETPLDIAWASVVSSIKGEERELAKNGDFSFLNSTRGYLKCEHGKWDEKSAGTNIYELRKTFPTKTCNLFYPYDSSQCKSNKVANSNNSEDNQMNYNEIPPLIIKKGDVGGLKKTEKIKNTPCLWATEEEVNRREGINDYEIVWLKDAEKNTKQKLFDKQGKILMQKVVHTKKKAKPSSAKEKGKIFISHSSKDKKVIEAFQKEILELGMQINGDTDIFCTSITHSNIESGKHIKEKIKEKLENAEVVFLLISPNYIESDICLNEMGAAWIMSNKKVIPIAIPPTDYKSIGYLYQEHNIKKINETETLNDIREILCDKLKIGNRRKDNAWEKYRETFQEEFEKIGIMEKV